MALAFAGLSTAASAGPNPGGPSDVAPPRVVWRKSISDVPPPVRTELAPNAKLGQATVDAANAYVQRNYATDVAPYDQFVSHHAVYVVGAAEQAGDPSGYFDMHAFSFVGGHSFGGYVGLQTRLINCTPGCANVGRGGIFAIWGATGATAPAGAPAGTIVVNDTELGEPFWAIHRPIPWVGGHNYQMVVTRGCCVQNGFTTVVTAVINDLTGGGSWSMGTITVPSSVGGFVASVITDVEEYTPSSYASCGAVPVHRAKYWDAYMHSAFTGAVRYPTTSVPYIQSGTGCTNSASTHIGSGIYNLLVGATS